MNTVATEPITIGVLLVDDHEVVRAGLRTLLAQYPRIRIAGEADSIASALARTRQLAPDIVLLDIRLPDGPGYKACRPLREIQPGVKVLILTSYADERTVLDALAAGADGYLLKEANSEALLEAIERIVSGQSVLDPAVTAAVLGRLNHPQPGTQTTRLESLSPQEIRVLELVAEGRTNRDIATRMNLSENTVKNYFRKILAKLELDRRSQAVAYFLNNTRR